jgi:hypothetical protein
MEPYKPRAFRFIELCRFGKWQMQLYGIADQGEFPRTELLAAAKKIAAIELAKFKPIEFTSDLLAYTMDAMRRLFLSVSGETRTSFFTAYFFPGVISLLIFLPRAIRTRPSAFGTWHCNHLSAQPGSNMCC